MCTCAGGCTHLCVCVRDSPPYFLRHGFLLDGELTIFLELSDQRAEEDPPVPTCSVLGHIQPRFRLCCLCVSTSPTKLSPHPLLFYVYQLSRFSYFQLRDQSARDQAASKLQGRARTQTARSTRCHRSHFLSTKGHLGHCLDLGHNFLKVIFNWAQVWHLPADFICS